VPRLDRLWYDLELRTTQFEKGLGLAKKKGKTFVSWMKAHPIAVAGALGVALTIAATAAVKAFANFDDKLTKSLAIMGKVGKAMRKDMSDAARDMARRTSFSASEVAESYFYLASAGLNAEQSLAALPQVAMFAQAGMFNLATATDLLTDAQSALGLTVDDASQNMKNMARVSDVLVKANTLANATVQQFSEALTREAGAALKSFNIDIEEGVAVLAAFADQGVKSQIAGTGLSRILRLMTTAANNNQEAMERLNLEVFDSEGKIRNLADIVGNLETALGDMSDQERTAALESIGFTARVQGIILPLLGTSNAIREYEAQLRQATGVTGEVAAKNLASLKEQAGLLKAEFADLALELGETLAPAAGFAVQVFREWFDLLRGEVRPIKVDTAITAIHNLTEVVEADTQRMADAFQRIDPTLTYGEALERAEKRQKEVLESLRKNIDEALGRGGLFAGAPTLGALGTPGIPMPDLEAPDFQEFGDAQLLALRAGIEQLRAAGEFTEQEDRILVRRLAQLRIVLRERGLLDKEYRDVLAGVVKPEPKVDREELSEEAQSAIEQARKIMVAATKTMVDNAQLALVQYLEVVKEAGVEGNEEVQRAINVMADNIRVLAITEPIEEQLKEVEEVLIETFDPDKFAAATRQLIEMEEVLLQVIEQFPEGSTQAARIQALLDQIKDKREALADAAVDAFDKEREGIEKLSKAEEKRLKAQEKAERERLQRARNLIDDLEDSARAVLKLADAFGFLGDEGTKALQDIIDVGAGLGKILSGVDVQGGMLQIAGGAASLLSTLFGGESEHARIVRENTEAIKALSRNMQAQAAFISATPGTRFANIQAALENLFNMMRGVSGPFAWIAVVNEWRQQLERLGLGMSDVVQIGKDLGITFENEARPNLAELRQVMEAMAEIDIAQAFDTFIGQMQELRAEFELFDITDPADQLKRLRDLFLEFTELPPGYRERLMGADISTAEGRRALEQTIQQLFRAAQQGGVVGFEQFGELTRQEFIDQLIEMERLLDQLGENIEEEGETQQFAISRTITEVTGSRMLSALTTDAYWNEQTASNTAEILRMMGGTPVTINPPVTGAMATPGAAIQIELNVNVHGAVSEENAAAVGATVGERIAEVLEHELGGDGVAGMVDRELGQRARDSLRVTGDILME
jgi:TP901 family phage tail tape measure protein